MNAKENEKISEANIDTNAEENKGDKKPEKDEVRTLSCLFFTCCFPGGWRIYFLPEKSCLEYLRMISRASAPVCFYCLFSSFGLEICHICEIHMKMNYSWYSPAKILAN